MEQFIMNWFKKIAQRWIASKPDYDIGNHLHAAFSAVLPEADGKSWEETPDVFYINSDSYRYLGNKSTYMGFFFMYMNRYYRLDVLIWQDDSGEHDPIRFMKQHGFTGKLKRVYSKKIKLDRKELGTISAKNPKDFIDQVITVIKSDFDRGDDGNEEDPGDIFPQWPYEETKYKDSDEESRALRDARIRGNRY